VFRRSHRPDEGPSLPSGAISFDAAQEAVAGFYACTAFEPSSGEVASIEVVSMNDRSAANSEDEPGICLTWRQAENQFGLLMTLRRLAEQSGGLDSVPFYLRLAVDEPHGPTAGGAVRWFSDLPSSPN
jgi:hypothetical protein